MPEFFDFMQTLLFGFLLGFLFEKFLEEKSRKNKRICEEENSCEEDNLDPVILRSGIGVTRCKNPTFAEQCVNIMKFVGEDQTEVDYEEENFRSEDDMG
ncbi:MAG: hypothetical protein J6J15_01380 [Oscillospiraceae bacterium]|nr:hypothetical protein [Oscillospiraceae bacterium]